MLLGPDEMEGEYAGEKLRKEVNFFYPINSIKSTLFRKGMEREGESGGRYKPSFSWLSCWLKWKQVAQILHTVRSYLMMYVIFMHQYLFPHNSLVAESPGNIQMVSTGMVFIRLEVAHAT